MSYTYPQQQFVPQAGHQQYRPVPQNNWGSPSPIQQIRPVSSIEEVKASPIDFDGSVFYFPDVNNRRIYTKSINLDGTVAINLYELAPIEQLQPESTYVTRQEFENVINQLKNMVSPVQVETKEKSVEFNF